MSVGALERFSLPGDAEQIEPTHYHIDSNNPEEADLLALYAVDTQEPVQMLPEPVAPRETGQFTGSVPERPEEQATQSINEGRFGFGALRLAMSRRHS